MLVAESNLVSEQGLELSISSLESDYRFPGWEGWGNLSYGAHLECVSVLRNRGR